jgi:hypothetical protein
MPNSSLNFGEKTLQKDSDKETTLKTNFKND